MRRRGSPRKHRRPDPRRGRAYQLQPRSRRRRPRRVQDRSRD
ncbi:hypothetical protein STAWA0001_0339, partial [Staphylococcus warneri L37603]